MLGKKDTEVGTSHASNEIMASIHMTSSTKQNAIYLPSGTTTRATFTRGLLSWEVLTFFAICVADMVTTLWWTAHGIAVEGNPLLAPLMKISPLLFTVAKTASFLPALIVCSYYRVTYPGFVSLALRIAIASYLTLYLVTVGLQLAR